MQKNKKNWTVPSQGDLADAIEAAMCATIGTRKQITVAELAHRMDCSESYIYKLKSGQQQPSAVILLQMMAAVGPDFANKILMVAGFAGASPIAGQAESVLETAARMGTVVAEINSAASDGTIDHSEALSIGQKLSDMGDEISAQATELLGKGATGASVSPIKKQTG